MSEAQSQSTLIPSESTKQQPYLLWGFFGVLMLAAIWSIVSQGEIDFEVLQTGLIPGVVVGAVAALRRRFMLALLAVVITAAAGYFGEYMFSIPMALNFLVTALVLPPANTLDKFVTYKRSAARYIFLLPGVYWILTFTVFPLLYSLYLSFTNANMRNFQRGFDLIGFANYADVFTDLRVEQTIVTSVFLTVGSVLLTLLVGTFVAWLFNHDELPGLRVFRSVMTMPLFAAPIALGFMGLILFNETSGTVNYILTGLFGFEEGVKWITDPWAARTAVLLLDAWQWTPFVFIVVLASMQSISKELYEAAELDTASSWVLFRYITLPLIAPALGTVALLRLVETFKILDIPLSMLGGGPGAATQTFSYYIYITGLRNFDMGYGSALAYMLVLVSIVVTTIYFVRMRERFQ